MRRLHVLLAALVLVLGGLGPAAAQAPFARGWTLDPGASVLRFQSVKNQTKVEQSAFATLAGGIEEDGTATVRIALDSVNTGIDLRNVRMRFLFFETYLYPEALVSATVSPTLLTDLATVRRKIVPLTFTLALHGVTKEMTTNVAVTLLSEDLVSIASDGVISVPAADFNLTLGIQKLEEAAGVKLIPSATVTFDLTFRRRETGGGPVVASAGAAGTDLSAAAPGGTALEARGDFDREACLGRFEILSKTDSIYFRSGSARIDGRSAPVLGTVLDIVRRCPGVRVEIAGHTDADGADDANQRLSEQRARAVARYLAENGIPEDRLFAVGYGESRPAFPNDGSDKWRNRRIEFAAR